MKFVSKAISRWKHFKAMQPTTVNYGIDGLLVLGAMGIAGNNNNLFALRLGATEVQLSLLHFFPSIFAMVLMMPAGIFTDSLKNKRRMITASMLSAAIFYMIVALSPFAPFNAPPVYFFLIFVGLASVSINGIYNLAWQAFFPEAVPEESRNHVLTFRARMTMIVSMLAPLTVGIVLFMVRDEDNKIITHQAFYVLAAALVLGNLFHFRKITATSPTPPKRVSFTEMKAASKRLANSKQFIFFTLAILLFHMAWHFDWTLYFITQATYLQMNDFLLNLTPVAGMTAQLLTIKYWSKRSAKHESDRPLTFGIFGLALNPIAVIVATSLPAPFGIPTFLVLHFVATLAFANVTLNVFQSLLKVVDNEYRSFFIAIYSCLIMLSNALMPRIGVGVYNGFGGGLRALQLAFVVAFAIRITAGGLWILRVRYFEKYTKRITV